MTCVFASFLIVVLSYQDDVWLLMKGIVQWNFVYDLTDFRFKRALNPDRYIGRPALNLLGYRASLKDIRIGFCQLSPVSNLYMQIFVVVIFTLKSYLREPNIVKKSMFLGVNHNFHILGRLKGLLHCFSTCIEITGNNRYCFILKKVENCKEKFQRVKKL